MDKTITRLYLRAILVSNLSNENKMKSAELTGYIDGLTDLIDLLKNEL